MNLDMNTSNQKDRLPSINLAQTLALAPGVVFQLAINQQGQLSFPYTSPRLLACDNTSASLPAVSTDDIFKLVHPDDLNLVKNSIAQSKAKLSPWLCDFRVFHEGRLKWVRGSANQEQTLQNTSLWHGIIIDITDLKTAQLQLEESEQLLREAQQLASIGHWYANLESGELYWSDTVFNIFGLERAHTSPTIELFNCHVHCEDVPQLREREAQARETGSLDVELRIIRPDGTIGWVHLLGQMNFIRNRFHGTIQDITNRKKAERELRDLASKDPLTKLYNRHFFNERSNAALKLCERIKKPLVVIMFDLDRFKVVNDTYGHATGDKVLQKIAKHVKQQLRAEDVLGRIGGEEFAITLPDTSLAKGNKVAEKLRASIEQLSFESLEKSEIFSLTCSFGVTERLNSETLDELLALADDALYAAKRGGRNRVEHKLAATEV